MMSRFEPWKWLKSLTEMKDLGSKEFAKGNTLDARNHYCNIIAILESVYKSSPWFSLSSMPPQFGQAVDFF